MKQTQIENTHTTPLNWFGIVWYTMGNIFASILCIESDLETIKNTYEALFGGYKDHKNNMLVKKYIARLTWT